jgi:transposase
MGHAVRLIPPVYVKPHGKRGNNGAAGAAAIEPGPWRGEPMRFVPVKSEEQQAALMLHKTRELPIKQRTMGVNSLRGHLSEFGIVAAKGIGRIGELIETAESGATLPETAKAALKILAQHLEATGASIAALDQEIATVHAQNPISRLLAGIPGVGKIAAPAIAASVPDPKIFKPGRDFSAWRGLTPRQNSSGGKERLGAMFSV